MESNLTPFGEGVKSLGVKSAVESLGGKGANLGVMGSVLNFPVPVGVTVPTEVCNVFLKSTPEEQENLLEDIVKKVFIFFHKYVPTSKKNIYTPFMPLVSVRSGARVSMPGMMDTILNVGLSNKSMPYYLEKLGEVPALDCYRRLIQMYGTVVKGHPLKDYESTMFSFCKKVGASSEKDLTPSQYFSLLKVYRSVYKGFAKEEFPQGTRVILKKSLAAVFNSWNTPRAKEYRRIHNYPDSWGTAVNIQAMVFGNLGETSCSGVGFTRNPDTGEAGSYGEFLVNAQGEDVVAGIRTPLQLTALKKWDKAIHSELRIISKTLENHYRDMMEFEFTVEEGRLYLLQTRVGKRSLVAQFKVMDAFLEEGFLSWEEVLKRISIDMLAGLQQPVIRPGYKKSPVGVGLNAGGGIVSGQAVFSSKEAVLSESFESIILITEQTTPDDIAGINVSAGLLTQTGGITCHAAVVSRGMGKTCVVGLTSLEFEYLPLETKVSLKQGKVKHTISPGDWITINGDTGEVWFDKVPLVYAPLGIAQEFISRTLEGVNFIPVSKTFEGAYNNHVLIPFYYYGDSKVSEWVNAVKEAVDKGYEVSVSFVDNYRPSDVKILSLFSSKKVLTEEKRRKALEAAGVLDAVQEQNPGESAYTLDSFLQGNLGEALEDSKIKKIFGNKAAYSKIKILMRESKWVFNNGVIVENLIKYLSVIWGC